MTEEVIGTFVGRWYVTIFGVVFLLVALRHLGEAHGDLHRDRLGGRRARRERFGAPGHPLHGVRVQC